MIAEKHMVVIFGSTGDLNKRKIIPALYHLKQKRQFCENCPIVCIGRREYSKEEFIGHLELEQYIKDADPESLTNLIEQIEYVQFDLDGDEKRFRTLLDGIAEQYKCGTNKLIYLALPARVFGQAANLIKVFTDDDGWQRVVFEKPFGEDSKSADELNKTIQAVLKEEQIYRVDHYLGKELVQNIFTLRFHNEMFKWAWHKDAIDHIQITASESLGVEERAGYYDKSGAVRDMVQNHLLQLLSLVAMEPPGENSAEAIRDATGNVMRALVPVSKEDVILGQYEGYTDESGVVDESITETFAAFKVFVDTPRWEGVPFYLKTGKKLDDRYADVKIVFKHDKELCKQGDCDQPNVVIIRIQPDDGIAIAFNVKKPGDSLVTEPVLMDFCHHCYFGPNTPEAYESILINVIQGEASSFPRWDWIQASWKFIDLLRQVAAKPKLYTQGSTGPLESDLLISHDERRWIHGEISPRTSQTTVFSLKDLI